MKKKTYSRCSMSRDFLGESRIFSSAKFALSWAAGLIVVLSVVATSLSGCSVQVLGDDQLARNVYVELVDWHISGLWIINSPVCWIRAVNYNNVPVKDVRIRFKTFGYNGEVLSSGTYTLEGTIGPGGVKNYMEQSIGVVDLESDMLSIETDTVQKD